MSHCCHIMKLNASLQDSHYATQPVIKLRYIWSIEISHDRQNPSQSIIDHRLIMRLHSGDSWNGGFGECWHNYLNVCMATVVYTCFTCCLYLLWQDFQSIFSGHLLTLHSSVTRSSNSTSSSVQTYESPFFFNFAILILLTTAACSRRRSGCMCTMLFYGVCRDRLITHYRHLLAWHAYVGVINRFCIFVGTEKYS